MKNSKNTKLKKNQIKLGVNIDHAATLRQVRGNTTSYPSLLNLMDICKKAGAHQITIHLREDRRHIQDQDVIDICKKRKLPINLELALSDEIFNLALQTKPDWCCFVPEKREELTTEGGLDVLKNKSSLREKVLLLKDKGVKSSMFIEAHLDQVKASADIGAEAVEFHTGHWVLCKNKSEKSKEWHNLKQAAKRAHELGLRVHAGHGLDLKTCKEIKKLPYLQEVNIGHSIICYSLEWGLFKTIKNILKVIK